ncbi:MAG: hypothetical protein JW937_05170 [Candidatus Omnitrophica bacterium]|nr:hypothetical protein [Candidatus Omnitrophota bacterium]
MNFFAFTGLVVFINSLIFAVLFSLKGAQRLHRIWVVFNIAVALWGLSSFKFATAATPELALKWLYIGHFGVTLIPVFFLHFVFEFLQISKPRVLRWIYGISSVFFVANVTDMLGFTRLFIIDARYVFGLFYVDSPPGPLYGLFVLFFVSVVVFAHHLGIRVAKVAYGLRKTQISYFLWTSGLGFAGGCSAFPMVFGIDLYPWLHATVPAYPLIMSIAIARYRLLDLHVAVARVLVFFFVYLATVGIPLLLLIYFRHYPEEQQTWWLYPAVSFLVLAAIAPVVYSALLTQLNRVLLKRQRSIRQAMVDASIRLPRIRGLDRLSETVVRLLTMSLQLTHCSVWIREGADEAFVLKASRGLSMHAEETGIVLPCLARDKAVALLEIGEKKEGAFSVEDLDALGAIATQTALAIENIRYLEELNSAQDQLVRTARLSSAGELAAGMAHEIRNPLSALTTFAEYLPEKHGDPEFLHRLQRVLSSETARIKALVDQILEFARPKPPDFEQVNPGTALQETLELLSSDLIKNRIQVNRSVSEQLGSIMADPQQLKQVFLNLIQNALQAMPEGGTLSVSAQPMENGGTQVEISDTGQGISKEDLKKIWDPFFSTKDKGTGLGLSVVHGILERHGAQVEIESQPGVGTQIRLSFPLAPGCPSQ